MEESAPPRLPVRLLAVIVLFSLPPLTAEVLSGYQGHASPLGVVTGILIAGPLYGTVAVLIREITVRTGRGWPTIVLLSGAFGLVQAGLIDQSLLNHENFADNPYWSGLPTIFPGIDIDLSQVLVFVGGHLMVTFAAPIALVQGCLPGVARQPWLGRPGLVLMSLAYLIAAAVFCYELAIAPGLVGSPLRLVVVGLIVAAVVACAFLVPFGGPRRAESVLPDGWVPRPGLLAVISFLLIGTHFLIRQPDRTAAGLAWVWCTAAIGLLVLLGVLLRHWSRQAGWRGTHVVAVAGAPLLCTAVLAFAVPPVEGDWSGKILSNAVVLAVLLAALAWVWFATNRHEGTVEVV